MKKITVHNITFSNDLPFVLIAGPCVIENQEMTFQIAEKLKIMTRQLNIPFIFKASYDKANRTSIHNFRGPGIRHGLEILADIKKELNIPILTDIHLPEQASLTAEIADIIQIPAFLMRQTDLLVSAGKTNTIINIKKAQFSSVDEIQYVIEKIESTQNYNILLTERGTFFGYHNLVVDYRNLALMKRTEYPVIFDATHSVQRPGAGNGKTIGNREFIEPLARAAVAIGIAGLFMEVHPEPDKGLSDSANMFPLDKLESLLIRLKNIDRISKNDKTRNN